MYERNLQQASVESPMVAQREFNAPQTPIEEMANLKETKEYIYVVGNVYAHFPNLSIEKEFQQACLLSNVDTLGMKGVNDDVALSQLNKSGTMTDTLYKALSKKENSYIAREMNWLFYNVDGNEVYTLQADSDQSLLQFVAALGVESSTRTNLADQDGIPTPKVIMRGQMMTNGRVVVSDLIPIRSTRVDTEPSLHKSSADMNNVLDEIRSLNANNGIRNEDRAINYVLYNNPKVFSESYNMLYGSESGSANPNGYRLGGVEVDTYWSGERLISKVIFNYQGINTGARRSWYTTVDVTGEYPFQVVEWKTFLPQYS